MSVYKPKNSTYYHFDFQYRGRRFHGSTGCANKRAAEAVERKERARAALGSDAATPITLDEACLAYWASKGQYHKSDSTEYQLETLVKLLGKHKYLHEITQRDFQAYIDKRRDTIGHRSKRPISTTSINREIEVAQGVWKHARLNGCDVPAPGTPKAVDFAALYAPEKLRVVELREEDEAKVIAHLPPDLAALVLFALLSGQRKGALITLRHDRIDWSNMRATVTTKGDKEHAFPLTPPLAAIIRAQPVVDDCPYVFTYQCRRPNMRQADPTQHRIKGQRYPFSPQGWRRDWKAALTAAGVADFRFHDLRHTSATRLLRACGNLKAVQALLGHSNVATTSRYAHVLDEDLRAAMDARDSRNSPGGTTATPPKRRRKMAKTS